MVLSSNMPSEIMDQRNTPSFYKSAIASSFYSEKIHIPSDKNLGLWETASMPDHSGLDAFPFMGGGKSVSSSALENGEHNFVDHIENSQKNCKEPQKFINFDHPQMGATSTADSWRIPNLGVTSMSKLYNQPTVSQKTGMNGGYYENGLFSSSMSDMFNRRPGLISNEVAIGQPANTTITNLRDVEAFESSEEVEAQTIGDLLPDDDDLFSGAIHDQGNVPRYNWTDVDDDLFCSVGGLELESDHNINSHTKMTSETDYSKKVNNKNRGSNMPQPSRTLLVKNIDNIEDTELRALFELYGDLQTFYSLSRNHGFIMVAYYDIRAAQNAEVMLQGGTINGQTLDIQFYVKDVFSESKTSDGVLLVTNINTSVSNDDLLHIFGRIGEIKEIHEISQNWDCRIIEFYDVRAADAAISALNGCDIAGKRIKVEPWCLRDSRFSSIQKSTLDIEGGDSSRFRQEIYPKKALLECFGTSSNHRSGSVPGSVDRRTFGIPYSIPRHIPSQSTISVIGNNDLISANSELSHSLGKMNLGSQNMASFPDFRDGIHSGMQFNSPNTMSAMAMNINSTLVSNRIDSRSMHRVGSIGNTSHSFELNKSGFSSGNGDYVWNDSNAYRHLHPGSMSWQNLAPYMNNNIIQAQTPQVHGLSRGPSHMPNHILAPNHHVGSAPSIAFHPNSLGSMGYSSCSPLHSYDFSSQNIFPAATGTNLESSISSTHVGTPSSQPRAHTYRAKSNTSTRSRRSHSSANQSDSSRQFDLDLDRISRGEDLRTTLMIKNIPNKYTSKMLLATIDEQHKGTYDFIYLPIDFKNKCNVGYAFINMTDPQHIIPFYKAFNGKKWEKFNSEKVAYLAYARIQGKAALIGHFQNSSLMSEDKRCRPILFHTDGPNAGDQEPFPVPAGANIRYRRSRTNAENNQSSTSGSSSEEDESSTSPKDFE